MPKPSLRGTLEAMIIRLLGASIVTVFAKYSIFLALFGPLSQAQTVTQFFWLSAFVLVAWGLLPAVRFNIFAAILAAVVWFGIGVFAATVEQSVFEHSVFRGLLIPAWSVASLAFAFFITIRPPHYLTALCGRKNRPMEVPSNEGEKHS